eukprot:CAMPEP_0168628592 /NCGR_PEP_ID=MMETSP0449_2-20121227/11931_1 /TAXON_ID=1082188 /ORGANISM="Strombidium rassoulzadegani, Strain ras09" /LENGTH=68 /DNA_ID=CAMNT_0008671031 /DNA_START=249 /DNA_END=455 /DNA_ORIENTATION=-
MNSLDHHLQKINQILDSDNLNSSVANLSELKMLSSPDRHKSNNSVQGAGNFTVTSSAKGKMLASVQFK